MPSAEPLVSIVILSWNRRDALQATLHAVARQEYTPVETIVVDNRSTDGSPRMVETLFPDVRLITLPHNAGIEGLNVGLRAVKGEIIVLLDDDSFPLPDALPRLVAAFQDDARIGIAACRIINSAGTPIRMGRQEEETGGEVATFIGCGVGIRREALEEAGLFDGAFFLYGNELDLAARVMEAGYTVRYFPEVVFVHAISPVNRTNFRAEYYCIRNLLWIIWKYFPFGEALGLSLRLIVESIGYRLLRGNLRRTWTVLRGVGGALTTRREPLKRRVLSRETRRRLLTYIDDWYPPAWAWLRAHWLGKE